jgi:hypothetical protein
MDQQAKGKTVVFFYRVDLFGATRMEVCIHTSDFIILCFTCMSLGMP